ncbi:MAG: tetratricopeptide repeat protein [Raineya sp.]|nr:tetratricopeptide repeat protein [Raineya sp.]MDW8295718.1 tetratricopeptide repeat protein [Raineya sp.]
MKKIILWVGVALFLCFQTFCQDERSLLALLETTPEDTNKVRIYQNLAYLNYQKNNYMQAQNYAESAIALADKIDFKEGKAKAHFVLGDIFKEKQEFLLSLKSYFQTERIYTSLNRKDLLPDVYSKIGDLYKYQQQYTQAIVFYEKALEQPNIPIAHKINILDKKAFCHKMNQDYNNAYASYKEIYNMSKDQKKNTSLLKELAHLSKLTQKYRESMKYVEKLLEIHEQENDYVEISNDYNNLGFLAQKMKDIESSQNYFKKALEVYEQQIRKVEGENKATLLINTGVAYTNLEQYAKAKRYYQEAIRIREKLNKPVLVADAYNYQAANYLMMGNMKLALKAVHYAIELGEQYKSYETLQTSYQLLALIAQQEKDKSKEEQANKKLKEIQKELNEQANKRKEEIQQSLRKLEKEENDLKNLLVMEEKNAAENKRLALEKERQEKEIALLKQEKELREARYRNQQLEQEKMIQLLALSKQKAETERQKAEAERERAERERQEAIALQQKQANEILQKESALRAAKDEAIKKEQARKIEIERIKANEERIIRFYTTIALLLTILFLIFAIYAYLQNKKKNKLLAQQNNIINEQNEELKIRMEELAQQQQEIMAQRDFIESQKNEIEEQYVQIRKSINAAEAIQRAILPSASTLQKFFPESYVIYKPRDIVSGDLYWANQVGDFWFVAAVDCTGHGVPGAFVSMIANTMLDNVIKAEKILEPAEILEALDLQLKSSMKSDENMRELTAGGMDVCLVRIRKVERNYEITYAGAKRPLYYIEPLQSEVNSLKPNRRSIGGFVDQAFSSQTILLPQGSRIYLSSDGLTDQNNLERQKFGEKRLKELIAYSQKLPMQRQKEIIEKALRDFQQGTFQRDDILFWGIELKAA